jgi:ferritin
MAQSALVKAINAQVGMEFGAAYLYLSMAADFEHKNLKGLGKWMRKQHEEELKHAMKFVDFLLERGQTVALPALGAPKTTWKTTAEAFKDALAHEQKVTASITKLYDLALKEGDYPAQVMLQWFVTEQVEEENQVIEVLAKLDLAGDSGAALLMLDHQLGERD